jgi:nifR3 family TIM-barrel protein
VPVTVKMRMGLDDETLTFLDAGRAAEAEGAAAVALHARTAEQLYSGTARWPAIGELKVAVASVPVLGNGDIWAAEDALAMVRETGCDGVVVGRGCLGKPWLFRDLVDVFAGRTPQPPPAVGEVVAVMRRHARLLAEAKGDEAHGIRDFRKHVAWYLTGYPVGGAIRKSLASSSSLAELDALLDTLDPSTPLPAGAERLARGHTQGPREVALPEGWRSSAGELTPPEDVFASGG